MCVYVHVRVHARVLPTIYSPPPFILFSLKLNLSLMFMHNYNYVFFLMQYAKARILLDFAKVSETCGLVDNIIPSDTLSLQPIQDAYTGYEFEARLNFKVHSALNSLR